MSYIGNTPGVSSQRVVTEEVISGSPKSAFYPIGGYALGYVDVLVNGLEVDSSDFTAADGVVVTLGTAAAVGDTVKIKCYLPRGLSDGYLKSEADAKFLPKTGGTLTGDLVLDNGSADGAQVVLKSLGYSNWNIDNYSGRLRAYYGSTEYFSVDSNGNIGAGGVVPKAWGTGGYGFRAIDIGNYGALASWVTDTRKFVGLYCNAYLDSTSSTVLKSDGVAASYRMFNGAHYWGASGSGTAGNAVTVSEYLQLDTGGNLSLTNGNLVLANGKGIDFSAGSNASGMTSELLDDYEQGTWTPTDASGSGVGFNNNSGYYIKIGRMVYVSARMFWNTNANGSAAKIGGLPFSTAGGGYAVGYCGYTTNGNAVNFRTADSSSVYVSYANTGGNVACSTLSNAEVQMTFMYVTT